MELFEYEIRYSGPERQGESKKGRKRKDRYDHCNGNRWNGKESIGKTENSIITDQEFWKWQET